ncbi:MAG: efflux RND transporter permease subunit [Gammaproteobacteria bacterium]|nr:efflux RND transporter permease subunit [Gammaproteobacteria bacterium]
MIRWFARNHVAANLLMFAIIVMGISAVRNDIGLELMPDFELGRITITTVLPGGNPSSIEETITVRIEEAVADLEGVKKVNSRSSEDLSLVSIEIESGYPELDLLNDVKVRVDSLTTLPADAERPVIDLARIPITVVGLAVYGDVEYDVLFKAAEDMRQALLRVDGITQVSELQAPPRELHIEVRPDTLQQFDLSLAEIGAAIQRNAIDISAGNLRTEDGDILIRTDGQAFTADQFAAIPIRNSGDRVLYLGDIANVVDGYVLQRVETQYNGQPAITIETFRIGKQNTIEVANKVQQFMRDYEPSLPPGLKLGNYNNTAEVVESRLTTLLTSALQGGLLVLILLSLFLRPAVAFWVGLGIPISFLGGLALMPLFGLSLNMLTMFAFLLVLGIVVDDAIVTGENIYRHQRNGMAPADAALHGTLEVAVPVTFGVVTTMMAFAPLLMVEGILSDLAIQIPLVIIPVLAFSLVESKLILPSHMSTIAPRDEQNISWLGRTQQKFSRGFETAIIRIYRPFLDLCIANKTITIVTAAMVFTVTVASMNSGWLRSSFFPEFEDNAVFIRLTMPTTTGFETTRDHIERIVDISGELANEYIDPNTGESYFRYFVSVAGLTLGETGPVFGSNRGMVIMEFVQGENGMPEGFSVKQVQNELRNRIGDIPGAERLDLQSTFGDFGRPISVVIYGQDFERIAKLVDRIREYLRSYPGVFDIQDNYSSRKEERQMTLTSLARSLGLAQADIAAQVRQAVYGFEAQRIQRGHEELKVIVRYPEEFRSSINDVRNIAIRSSAGGETIPLQDLAVLTPTQSPAAIYRDKQRRAITVSANVDSAFYDVNAIRADLRSFLDELFIYEAELSYNMDGQAESMEETNSSFALGFVVVIIMIYSLLAIPFRSFGQPLVVMSIIPLAIVGAIVGHYIMDLAFSMLSIMGVLGLTGIVVNDSLVLVDYINQKRREGMELMEAVLTAGETRFRPVILTSLTTFAGLLPLMLNRSTQAQTLVPMAVSLGFGIIFATVITLVITPVNYLVGHRIKHASLNRLRQLRASLANFWNKPDATAS